MAFCRFAHLDFGGMGFDGCGNLVFGGAAPPWKSLLVVLAGIASKSLFRLLTTNYSPIYLVVFIMVSVKEFTSKRTDIFNCFYSWLCRRK